MRVSGLEESTTGGAVLLLADRDGLELAADMKRRLCAQTPGRIVTACAAGSLEALLHSRPGAEQGLASLGACGTDRGELLVNVDPRDLHTSADVLRLDREHPYGLVVCLFPYIPGNLDDVCAQRVLIEQILCSLSRLAASSTDGGRFRLCLVLHPEHFCSWRVFQAARQLGWALEDASGYSPATGSLKGAKASGRPAKDAKVYTFSNALLDAVVAESEALCSGVPARCWAPPPSDPHDTVDGLAVQVGVQCSIYSADGDNTPTRGDEASSDDGWPATPPTDERLMKSVMLDIMNSHGGWEEE